MIKTFMNNPSKRIIREIDKKFIEDEYKHHSKKLKYFGLPSEGFYDIIQWNEFIGDIVAVERGSKSEPASKQSLVMSRAFQYGLHNRLTLLRGDINQIILDNKDDSGKIVSYPFEIVNLDYGGSVLYPNRMRVKAIKKLIEMQRPTNFLLLITSNIREFDETELLKTQQRIRKELMQYTPKLIDRYDNYINWSNKKQTVHRQVIHLNYMLKYGAEERSYTIKCHPPIKYSGNSKTELIHYITEFRCQENSSTRVISNQSTEELLKLEIYELKKTELRSLKSIKDFK